MLSKRGIEVLHPIRSFYRMRRIRDIPDISLWQIVKYLTDNAKTWTQAQVERKGEFIPDEPGLTSEIEIPHVALADAIHVLSASEAIVGGITFNQNHLDSQAVLVRRTTRLTQLLTRRYVYGKSTSFED